MANSKTKSLDMFDSLVRNAFDFLTQAINEIGNSPKYSVINFYAAVELFLKARLMLEHWALVLEVPQNANYNKFLEGNSRTVGLDEAIKRLKNAANTTVTTDAEKSFRELRNHRNKLIHFFHSAYIGQPNEATLQQVVAEQCRSWFYLYRLLTIIWKTEFGSYHEDITRLNQLMLKQRQFLTIKFEALLPDIKKSQNRGVVFATCNSCSYEASREEVIASKEEIVPDSFVSASCLVCENKSVYLKVLCPNCGTTFQYQGVGDYECVHCAKIISLDDVIDLYGEFQSPKEEYSDPAHACCRECETLERATVIPLDEDYLCLFCLALYDTVSVCEFCSQKVGGDLEDSFLSGCGFCDGRLGWGD